MDLERIELSIPECKSGVFPLALQARHPVSAGPPGYAISADSTVEDRTHSASSTSSTRGGYRARYLRLVEAALYHVSYARVLFLLVSV